MAAPSALGSPMIEATEVLHSYLRGIRRLSGAQAVSLYLPGALSGQSEARLLHDGEPPVPELADLERAESFAARFERRPGGGAEAGAAETPRMVPGTEADTLLIPLPALDPLFFWGLGLHENEESPATPGRRLTDEKPPAGLSPAAWIGLRLAESSASDATPPIPARFPVSREDRDGSDWLWQWLFTLGGAIASHTVQVSAIVRDPITGLPDRVGFQALLADSLERSFRVRRPLSLLLINPDDFASVNERFGREAGDRIIREISDRLRTALRKSDLVARYGGVIFAVLLLDTAAAKARSVAEKVMPRLTQGAYLDGAVRLGFSVGTALSTPDAAGAESPLQLIQRADKALNAAKRKGGGCISDWDPDAATQESGAFDRLSGIFTGNMAKDYRNMVLLTDALEVIAAQQEPEGLAAEVVERLYSAFRPERVALLGREEDGDDLVLVRGLTRQTGGPGAQPRIETVELGPRQRELLRLAVASGEPRTTQLDAYDREVLAYAVPLMASGRPLGCLYIDGFRGSLVLEASDLVFLEALASQLALAMDRARLAKVDRRRQELEKKQLRAELNELRQALQQAKMIYRSDEMEAVVATARRVAPTDATVLITGESGTGKELLARTVHELSPRRDKPMVVVDCGAIAATLIESELFGHEKGAFTGAQQRRPGRLAEANGGTVLLDEIGELPLEVQSKLLRFVQEKQFVTVGGTRPRRVDVRIVAATNRDLATEVAAGRFREDLFHRLNVIRLEIPPLRERPDDVLHLARHFLETYSIRYQKSARRLTPEAEARLLRYGWPGNVRELQNRLMQAVILCESEELGSEQISLPDAPPALGARRPEAPPATAAGGVRSLESPEAPAQPEPLSPETVLQRLRAALERQVRVALTAGAHAAFPLGKWLSEDLVLEANQVSGGVARRGAAIIGIPETTFRRRLQKANDRVQAGFSQRTGTWSDVRAAIAALVRMEGPHDEDLLTLAERLLLQEILAQVPDATSTGAKLLGVTAPTFRVRASRLAEEGESG